jgi:hypothetical protein
MSVRSAGMVIQYAAVTKIKAEKIWVSVGEKGQKYLINLNK